MKTTYTWNHHLDNHTHSLWLFSFCLPRIHSVWKADLFTVCKPFFYDFHSWSFASPSTISQGKIPTKDSQSSAFFCLQTFDSKSTLSSELNLWEQGVLFKRTNKKHWYDSWRQNKKHHLYKHEGRFKINRLEQFKIKHSHIFETFSNIIFYFEAVLPSRLYVHSAINPAKL